MPSHYKGAENEVRALNAFINLMRASDSLAARGALLLESQGLTHGQFGTMEALFHLGPLCQRALGEKLLRSGGNLTLVIDNLEKKGWVRRERQPDDRRKVLVSLTPKGRARIEKVFPAHVAFLTGEFSGLTSREQETLRRLCRKLGRSLGGSKGAQRSKGKGGASEA
jgi:MarR family 2-MHQ and catechol resistance regulon transcriptional repressor